MMTVDDLLLKIVNFTSPPIEESIQGRDARVLRSLATAVNTHYFITENQSRLLLKILKENQKNLTFFTDEISQSLSSPSWSKRFRKIDQVKKMYIGNNKEGELCIYVEFTFSSQIRKILHGLAKQLENLIQVNPGKLYTAELTEKNIVTLVEALESQTFEVDETIKNHYETIKSWSREDVCNQFFIDNITHGNFQKAITLDLGTETEISENVINDRSMRYQYFTKIPKKTEFLVDFIATRDQSKIWIDSTKYSLDEIIKSLKELRRLPLLVIFPNSEPTKLFENLSNLDKSLEKNEIFDDVGIYFRLPNDPAGKNFNQLIAEKKYNSVLDNQTKIVAIQNGKIPKFMIKNSWTPMSIISLDSNLRYNKSSIYANCCDLVISYSPTQSVMVQGLL
jgi:hypothetical protein